MVLGLVFTTACNPMDEIYDELGSEKAVISGDAVAPEIGNALPMKSMPLGTNIHNIELQPGQGLFVNFVFFGITSLLSTISSCMC